jgi:hypothetical protein
MNEWKTVWTVGSMRRWMNGTVPSTYGAEYIPRQSVSLMTVTAGLVPIYMTMMISPHRLNSTE